jgi:hypothetical protein
VFEDQSMQFNALLVLCNHLHLGDLNHPPSKSHPDLISPFSESDQNRAFFDHNRKLKKSETQITIKGTNLGHRAM